MSDPPFDAPTSGQARAGVSRWVPLAVPAIILAVLIYLDYQQGVSDFFPLRQHRIPPLEGFLLMATLGFPAGTMSLLQALVAWQRARRSETWPSVPGKIISSEVIAGRYNRPAVEYEYRVFGRTFKASIIRFGQTSTEFHSSAEKVVDRFPAGSKVPVFYDPDNPGVAVLDTTPAEMPSTILWGFAFLVAPFLAFSDAFRDAVLH